MARAVQVQGAHAEALLQDPLAQRQQEEVVGGGDGGGAHGSTVAGEADASDVHRVGGLPGLQAG